MKCWQNRDMFGNTRGVSAKVNGMFPIIWTIKLKPEELFTFMQFLHFAFQNCTKTYFHQVLFFWNELFS